MPIVIKSEEESIVGDALDEPLIDTTEDLPLHSKKLSRLQKRQQKKKLTAKVYSEITTFLEFPPEILSCIIGFLPPSTIYSLLRLNRFAREFILQNQTSIVNEILLYRYQVLKQCFPCPLPIERVPLKYRELLQGKQWQDRLRIHKLPYYQHIQPIDPMTTCTCMSCVLAWNNLCVVLDLAHWQTKFDLREPLPVIPRGRNPQWNSTLLEKNAELVQRAMSLRLAWARILQTHLNTTTRTILRSSKWRRKGEKASSLAKRLYHLSDDEVDSGTDTFLQRSGPPNYQPIYMRDNYYNLEAWVPNRKWDKDDGEWKYYSNWPTPHDNDLEWLANRFATTTTVGKEDGIGFSTNH